MSIFKKKKTEDDPNYVGNSYELILQNNGVELCTEACSCCWDTPIPDTFEGKLEYIAKRAKIGHESIMEHSNYAFLFYVSRLHFDDIPEFLSSCRYIDTNCVMTKRGSYILFSGSIRGIKNVYRSIENIKNSVLAILTRAVYDNCPKEYFIDFINEGLMDADYFIDMVEAPVECNEISVGENSEISILNADVLPIDKYQKLIDLGFDEYKIDEILSVTILFRDMSRTATHQLVRHRNAITQESQRYVDYSGAMFNSPAKFKDKYDPEKKYHIKAIDKEYTMQELGELITTFYTDLREQNVEKEDARGFLPGNIQCRKIYMTFKFAHLCKFLELRTDKHAQAEIRKYAVEVLDSLLNEAYINENYTDHLMPYWKRKEMLDEKLYDEVDEVLEVTNEVIKE